MLTCFAMKKVRGMTLSDAGKVRNTEIARELCLPPVKCEFYPLNLKNESLGGC